MENLEEVLGQTIEVGGVRYYALNYKIIDSAYYFFCLNLASLEQENIFELQLQNGKVSCYEYNGKDYQAMMEEFHERETLEKCLEFMERQKESLAKEEEKPERTDTASDEKFELTPEQKENIDRTMAAFEKLARMAHRFSDDYDDSIAEFTKIIEQNPNDVDAYFERGNAYNQIGDYPRAIADFEMFLMLKPDDNATRELLEKIKENSIEPK
jgi:tetratricopeptide (TPR) repeat protein